jgi:hypothetical protein
LIRFFFLATDETTTEPLEIDLTARHKKSNNGDDETNASEKQTLKIEEVFTSSTRQSGIEFHCTKNHLNITL